MTIYDISVSINPGMPVWPGEPAAGISLDASIDRGDLTKPAWISLHTPVHTWMRRTIF